MARRVLIVEDDEDIRASLEVALRDASWEVVTASDGQDALRVALAGRAPDVILLDLMMPVMHGWQLAELLRAHPTLAHVPLVVSSAGDGDDRVRADATLHKPYSLDLLLRTLEQLVPEHELRPGA